MYRKQDLRYLLDLFNRDSNDIALLYGDRRCGLSEILNDFMKDRESFFYKASNVDETTQRRLFAAELLEQTRSPIFPDDDYEKLFLAFINNSHEEKKVIVFYDFNILLKENPTFINFMSGLLSDRCRKGSVMVLLVCDDIKWVENDMLTVIGPKSSEIAGVIKLNDFSPAEFTDTFPKLAREDILGIYSVVGGKSSYYDLIGNDTKTRDIVVGMLGEYAKPDFEPDCFLPRGIREPMLYNSILVNLAQGTCKLNDIHKRLDIKRAKLLTYIKVLADHGLVQKAKSAGIGYGDDTAVGVYHISQRDVLFYYRYVFPHLSSLRITGPERFYRKFIDHGADSFALEVFPLFCMGTVKKLAENDRLSFRLSSIEEYHDKSNVIDFVLIAAGGSVIACSCNRYRHPMDHKIYDEVLAVIKKNRLNCENIWFFSLDGFDSQLEKTASLDDGLKLYGPEYESLN